MISTVALLIYAYLCIDLSSSECAQNNITDYEHGLSLQCTDISDEELLKETFFRFEDSEFELFEVSNSDLAYIPTDSAIFTRTKIVKVTESSLDFFFAEAPPPLLSTIIFDNVVFSQDILDWGYFENLPNLDTIMIRDVEIPYLSSDFEMNMNRRLSILIFKRTNTSHLDENIFRNFVYLKDLRIESSYVKQVRRSMFARPATILEVISFEDNEILFLPKDLFADMPHLTNVDFSHNNIKVISVSLFIIIKNLEYLSFEGNPLTCDCDMRWIVWKKMSWEEVFSREIKGQCEGPDKVAGVELQNLLPSDFEHCPKDDLFKYAKKSLNMHVIQIYRYFIEPNKHTN